MRIPFLTVALSTFAEGGPDEGPEAERRPWPRPADREPPDDWSERTGIPSPFPCRAAMVWCDSAKTDRPNPDGTDRGAWVPASDWRSGSPADGERWDPAQDEELWAYVARLSRHEQFIVWPSGPDGDPVPPTFVYRLRVDDDGDHYDLEPPHTAVATIDPTPLREAAEQVADTAVDLQAAVDEAEVDPLIRPWAPGPQTLAPGPDAQ